jgi:excisionase family DNA binding protein
MGDETDHRLLTMRQAAALLGVSKETVRQRVKSGALHGRRDNRGRILVALPAELAAKVAARPDGVGGERGAKVVDPGGADGGLAASAKVGDQGDTVAGWQLTALLVAVAAAERRAQALEEHVTDLRQQTAALRAELERRRWPGLAPLLRRLWQGS